MFISPLVFSGAGNNSMASALDVIACNLAGNNTIASDLTPQNIRIAAISHTRSLREF